MTNKRELTKKCIEKTAEIVRFLLEANKRPKLLEELRQEELKEYKKAFALLTVDFYELLTTPREWFEIQQKEKERERLEALKRSGK